MNISLATGEARELVTSTNFSERQLSRFAWSRNGKYLAYCISNQTKTDSLMIYDAATGESKLLTEITGSMSRPSFMPEGEAVVYTESNKLYRIPATGGAPEQIPVQDRHGIPYKCANRRCILTASISYSGIRMPRT